MSDAPVLARNRAERRHPELLTRPEVAAYLRVAVKTMAQWATKGVGPRYRVLGGQARYDMADVLAWVAAQEPRGGDAA